MDVNTTSNSFTIEDFDAAIQAIEKLKPSPYVVPRWCFEWLKTQDYFDWNGKDYGFVGYCNGIEVYVSSYIPNDMVLIL